MIIKDPYQIKKVILINHNKINKEKKKQKNN